MSSNVPEASHNAVAVSSNGGCPVISFVGWSGSGKTTFLEQVVALLSSRGLHVGLIKHHGHTTPIDVEGKDSWRYGQAGASPIIVSSAVEFSILRKVEQERTLDELAEQIAGECDLILTEGYRLQGRHCIEFMREAHRSDAILEPTQRLALASDCAEACEAAHAAGTPVFAIDDPQSLASYLEGLVGEYQRTGLFPAQQK